MIVNDSKIIIIHAEGTTAGDFIADIHKHFRPVVEEINVSEWIFDWNYRHSFGDGMNHYSVLIVGIFKSE